VALPKRRHSRARRDKRRANWKRSAPALVSCPRCHKFKVTHRACPACGYYSPAASVPIKEKEKKAR
jgi:large subunit ribosomal protein L32